MPFFGLQDGDWDCNDVSEVVRAFLVALTPKDVYFWDRLYDNVALARNNQTRSRSRQVIKDHYNLGNDLYASFLDPTFNYTCAYWKKDTKTLEQAQINKMDLIARKLKLKPGMKVMDIGCGFGASAKYFAEKYGCSVVGYNISEEMVAFARKNCEGLNVEIRQQDYREATGQYDAIYSIGFYAHVGHKNTREYWEVVHRCLKPDGLTLLHEVTMGDTVDPCTNRWVCKWIFPGAEVP